MTETVVLAMLGGGIFGAISALVVAWWNKPKVDAETRSIIANASKTEQETIALWADKYEALYLQLEKERQDRKLEKEGERKSREEERGIIDGKIKEMQREIFDVQILKSAMLNQISKLQAEGILKDEKIALIEKENLQLRELVVEHGGKIEQLTRKTGILTAAAAR